jgi:inosine-uridine nucleoside N-ribohydrolase
MLFHTDYQVGGELHMQRVPVILDCDNTMGVAGCDIDDGLALLFLLGCNNINLLGVTCAYGNSSQETVFSNTVRLLRAWGREDIPVLRGSEDHGVRSAFLGNGTITDGENRRMSDAASFLAEKADEYAGELCIIAIGSMSNLAGAAETDQAFFKNVRTISLMGGITEELLVGGGHMDELNLSCDPGAALMVISEGNDVRIATAQNSLSSYFGRDEFNAFLDGHPGKLSDMLRQETSYWFDLYEKRWNLPGFVNWDVMAAVQLLHTDSLEMKKANITADIHSLRTGLLIGEGVPVEVTLPEIRDHELYFRTVYEHFLNAKVTL